MIAGELIELSGGESGGMRLRSILFWLLIVAAASTLTTALCLGCYRLGAATKSAEIFEIQNAKIERLNTGLMRLVGVVDEAKAREFASCIQAGRHGCESIIAPVVPEVTL